MVGIWWISSKWASSEASLKKGSTAMPDEPEGIKASFAPLASCDSTPKNWHIKIVVLFTITLIIKGFDSYTDWRVIDKAKENLIKYEGLSEVNIPKDLNGYCNFSFIQSYRKTLNVTTVLNDYRLLTTYATIIWYTASAVTIITLITGLKLYIRDNFTKGEKYDKSTLGIFMTLPLSLCNLENIPLNAIAIKVSRYEFGELRFFLCALKTIGSGNCSNTTGSENCSISELTFATDQELFINLLVSLIYSVWIGSITPHPSYYLFSRYYCEGGKCKKTGHVILGIIAGFQLHVTNYASIWFQLSPVGCFPEPFSKAILGMFITACVFLLIEVLMMLVPFYFSGKFIKKTEDKYNKNFEQTSDDKFACFLENVFMILLPVLSGLSAEMGDFLGFYLQLVLYFHLLLLYIIITYQKNPYLAKKKNISKK